jgi:glutamate synthase domain-containing protein 2
MRPLFFISMFVAIALCLAGSLVWGGFLFLALVFVAMALIGVHDVMQTRRAVLRNFPVIGHLRYLLEMIRPEINQYFVESNMDGTPFNREYRSVVYQRAKGALDTLPFGTQKDVYLPGYEWIAHSIAAKRACSDEPRVLIGGDACAKPYEASLLNISAMSFGSLSRNAVEALSRGAKQGGFSINTGEGGVSPYHLAGGGDLVWQIGTGYFGCRDEHGQFDLERFGQTARQAPVKMIEIKLSQGAKPGHGGILPAAKLTPEIASMRAVPLGHDVLSPPTHSAFSSPEGLLQFIASLRLASGGKPVGIKLCVGKRAEFMALCKVMRASGEAPDFIAVDGGEGGTGAAPIEFSNSVGMPLTEGLVFVRNCIAGFSLQGRIKIIASGKITTGFHMIARMAQGADLCNSARAMMMALGCIQARRCNSNDCPVGVATQNPGLVAGLDVGDKTVRVASFQHETVEAFLELLGAAGLDHPSELRPGHIMRRISATDVRSYDEIFNYIKDGALLSEPVPEAYEQVWLEAVGASDSWPQP